MSLVKDQIQLISQGTTVLHYCTVSSLHYVPSKCAAMSLDTFASVDVFKPCGWPKIIFFFMWSLAIIVFIHGCVSPCGGPLWCIVVSTKHFSHTSSTDARSFAWHASCLRCRFLSSDGSLCLLRKVSGTCGKSGCDQIAHHSPHHTHVNAFFVDQTDNK